MKNGKLANSIWSALGKLSQEDRIELLVDAFNEMTDYEKDEFLRRTDNA